ncbi:MAG: segregation/condensation protein A [Clostridia bacterium]|nr:segregation/condensation protein A [Clostridia bacterium]
MEKILYKLDTFEGPLDLLLHLITKNKVSIYDIPIAEITDQYLDALVYLDEMVLENSSEFLVMAAQLLYIKSKMLLPKPETETEEDPREDLAQRLAEYQIYKKASAALREFEFWSRDMVFRLPEKINFPIPEYDRMHDKSELVKAIYDVIERRKERQTSPKRSFYGIVGREKVSIEDMVEKVCKILSKRKKVAFSDIFLKSDSKPEKIATFLAVLEMIRLDKISADYNEKEKDFIIKVK